MRKIFLIAAAAIGLALGAVATTPRAEAMPAPAGLAAIAGAGSLVEDARVVCRRVWNGYRWRNHCVQTRPVYRPRPRYHAPRYYAPPRVHRPHRYHRPHRR
ncbi:MAG TPA: hypothetical protein VNQ99_05710 [Xanthobacteraceae bacterium]|nr:hypothetical protein [Xanthobacteraceae bacterium]